MHNSGPLAHPVERIHGMDEASGSSPLGSTRVNKTTSTHVLVVLFRKQTALLSARVEGGAL